MNEPMDRWESNLKQAASALPYPPTPDIARAVTRRLAAGPRPATARARLAWAIVIAIVVVAGLLAVPQVRAGLVEFLRIGGVRIFLVPPTATRAPPPSTGTPAPTATPRPTPTFLPSLLDLGGETTLESAQTRLGFSISLPAYPADLGQPDHVFLQDFGGPMVILVWLDPQQPAQVRLALHLLTCKECVTKLEPVTIQTTSVKGQPAVWAEGPYLMQLRSGDYDARRLIRGHVLIWSDDSLTYRLETDQPLDEALKIAESLRPLDK